MCIIVIFIKTVANCTASSTTAMIALQLAKRAGMRVICVADVAKNGSRLYNLGADVLVDRLDTNRAVDIIKSVSGGKLRFAFDASGKESAGLLQNALLQSTSGARSHLLGLTGLPSTKAPGVVHHTIPIKIFHDAPVIGETIMTWLEELLLAKGFEMPQIEIAEGGLAGVNAALDRLRSGTVSAKRIVVPVGSSSDSRRVENGVSKAANGLEHDDEDEELGYADKLNADPTRLKFAYWVPNVSGVSLAPYTGLLMEN